MVPRFSCRPWLARRHAVNAASCLFSVQYERVVITDQLVPGLTDVRFGGVGAHKRNNAGEIAFTGEIFGPSVTDSSNSGFFTATPSDISIVTREGDPAPVTPSGFTYGSVASYALNDAGTLAFGTGLRQNGSGSGITPAALFAASSHGAAPALLARATEVAPGTPGWTYVSFNDVSVTETGLVGYQAVLSTSPGTSGPQGLYTTAAAGGVPHQLVALSGNAAPGTPAGVTYRDLGSLAMSDSGPLTFRARLQGSGITSANDTAFFAGPANDPQLLIRAGTQAPGVEPGAVFQSLANDPDPLINSAGLGAVVRAGQEPLLAVDCDVAAAGAFL